MTTRIIIPRSSWRRGGGDIRSCEKYGETKLLGYAPDGSRMQCCLGHACSSLGVPDGHILNVGSPAGYASRRLSDQGGIVPAVHLLLVSTTYTRGNYTEATNSEFARKAIHINDDCGIEDKARERELRDLFATVGWELEFTDDVA